MTEFANQNEGMVSNSLTPISQAPTVAQQQMQQAIPQQQVETTEVEPRHKYKNTLYGIGISEITLGSISVIFGIATLSIAAENQEYYRRQNRTNNYYYPENYYYDTFTWTSQGIWCGLCLIASGILGIKAKSNPSVCMYNANMAMSIITANMMVVFTALSGIAVVNMAFGLLQSLQSMNSMIALHSSLLIVGFAAAVVCIVHSAYCCAGVCCRRTPYSGSVTYTAQPCVVEQPQHFVRVENGQYVPVSFQPGVHQGHMVMPNPTDQVVYQLPQGGAVVPMSGQPRYVQPTAAYPLHGFQQPVQVITATNAPPQGLTGVCYPTATNQVATDANRNQAPTAAYPPHDFQQPVQVTTATNAPPQSLAGASYPTAINQVATDVNINQANRNQVPTAAYPPHGFQQPVQVTTATNAPPQGLTGVSYPKATNQVATGANRNQAPTVEASPVYSPFQNEHGGSS